MMTAALAAGITACSDDHFDINSDVLSQKTIWQSIEENQNLTEYADILKSVKYSTTEEKTTPETYADVLNGEQTFTVWAPLNGTFGYDYYKGLLATGVRDSIYKVEKELIRNNMTRYARLINGKDSLKINLFNDKAAWINYTNSTIKNSNIVKANVSVSNGALHITDAPVAYQPNLYEFLASRPDISSINEFIKKFQKTEFNEFASTAGPTVDGEVTWVDSITYISNDYTNGFLQAYLNREDSNYVMVIPTNKAWDQAYAKTQKLYNYKSFYKQDVHTLTEQGADTTISGAETKFSDAELDSLANLHSKNAICQNLVYNANWQYGQIPITTLADVAKADSLRTTSGTKFKKPGTMNETNKQNCFEVDFNKIFGNQAPIELSNGYAFIVDDYTYPTSVLAPSYDLNPSICHETDDNNCVSSTSTRTYTKDLEGNPLNKQLRYTNFVMSYKNATSHPGSFFQLKNLLSCKYDIYVVIAYNTDLNMQNKFNAYISYDDESTRYENKQFINENDAVDAKGDDLKGGKYFVNRKPYYDENGEYHMTDTIMLAKDFEFPVCYEGLNAAFPVLQIKSNFKTNEKAYYAREIWVNAIILKAKEE